MTDARLDELDRDEWWQVAHQLRPDLSREDFDQLWGVFAQAKGEMQ